MRKPKVPTQTMLWQIAKPLHGTPAPQAVLVVSGIDGAWRYVARMDCGPDDGLLIVPHGAEDSVARRWVNARRVSVVEG